MYELFEFTIIHCLWSVWIHVLLVRFIFYHIFKIQMYINIAIQIYIIIAILMYINIAIIDRYISLIHLLLLLEMILHTCIWQVIVHTLMYHVIIIFYDLLKYWFDSILVFNTKGTLYYLTLKDLYKHEYICQK